MSRTWYVHEKTSSCQRCPASTTSASARRASASLPSCPSSHPVGGLVTYSASSSLDPLAAKPPGHRGGFICFTASLDAFSALARSASALAHDVATTARTQCATAHRSACRDYCLWTLTRVCPGP